MYECGLETLSIPTRACAISKHTFQGRGHDAVFLEPEPTGRILADNFRLKQSDPMKEASLSSILTMMGGSRAVRARGSTG